ncbi:Spo0E family sporulation regulatory protein-aspartic acid phosphatase [Metabacillus litoralis]|uniref:Spo0E family sporulation regulatory protein-aspartic acid phosphatase n=1 Tax=Metabacillus litoralis TaxID=152268 RepID=UPI00203B9B0B|nr:aspartyl-phosphate phosphatase Spo0E family protein [Metabacillus litoralis]MCM3651309.1 aspartyl-phosphate phosphatase Spo0E family protein [Metabacillus litoralis]
MIYLNYAELINKIQNLREQMIKIGKEKGLSNPETIKYSQELDVLIMKYQLLTYKKSG